MLESKAENNMLAGALDRLIAAHDGDVALLYLYWLRSGALDPERAAAALCRTRREIGEAEEKLRRIGLLDEGAQTASPQTSRDQLYPPEEPPVYTAEDLTARSREDETFSAILAEAVRVMGRNLSSNDMKVLFGIYDHLGLPPEVIFMLLSYCAEQYRERYGESRRPSARSFEKLAYDWARQEIMTIEQAESVIAAQKERRGELGEIKALLNGFKL